MIGRLNRELEPEGMDSPAEAAVYDAVSRAHAFLDRAFVRRLVRLGVCEGAALDVGCGSGRLTRLLAEAIPDLHVYGVDLSEAMLALARRDLGRTAGFVMGDAKRLPFADCSFDLVASHHTVHHLADPAPLLAEMVRVARPGGWVALCDLRRPPTRLHLGFYVRCYGMIYNKLGQDAAAGKGQYRASLKAALSQAEWERLAGSIGAPRKSLRRVPVVNHTDLVFHKPEGVQSGADQPYGG